MKLPVYNIEGKEVSKIELSDDIFGLKWNGDLVHQVVTSINSNSREPIAHTKDRSEVRGGGKKPWKQKGTGRARHGSSRSPLWRGGGITFGPRNDRNYDKKINKKVRAKALAVALSQKIRDNEIIFVDNIKIEAPKASVAKSIIEALSKTEHHGDLATKRKNAALVAFVGRDTNKEKSFANFSNIHVDEVRNLNPQVVLNYKYLVLDNAEEAVKTLVERLTPSEK